MAENRTECNSEIEVDLKYDTDRNENLMDSDNNEDVINSNKNVMDSDKNENLMEVEMSVVKEVDAKCEVMNIEGEGNIKEETLKNTDIVNDVGNCKLVEQNVRNEDPIINSINSVINNSDNFKSAGSVSLDIVTDTASQEDTSDSVNQTEELKKDMLVNISSLSEQTTQEDLFLKSNKPEENSDAKLVESSEYAIGINDNVDVENNSSAEVDKNLNLDIQPVIFEKNIGSDILESFQTVTKNIIEENSIAKSGFSCVPPAKTDFIDYVCKNVEVKDISSSGIDNKQDIVDVCATKFETVHVKSEFFIEEEDNSDIIGKMEVDENIKKSQICKDEIRENSDKSKVESNDGENSVIFAVKGNTPDILESFRAETQNRVELKDEDKFENDNHEVIGSDKKQFEVIQVKSEFNTGIIESNRIEIDENLGQFQDCGDEQNKNSYVSKIENEESKTPVILEVRSIALDILASIHDDTQDKTELNDEENKNRFDCASHEETDFIVPNSSDEVQKVSGFKKDKELFDNDTMKFGTVHVKSEFSANTDNDEEFGEKMEIEENLGNSPDYRYGNNGNSDNSKVNSKLENIEAEDFIVIEHCTPGIKNTSDKSFIKEGSAEILLSLPKVFYNPVQEFNRDMSIAALIVFAEDHQTDPRFKNRGIKRKNISEGESSDEKKNMSSCLTASAGTKVDNGITILEALSATGLRSIRYAKEIPGVKEIIANDISEVAVKEIKKNAEHNSVGDIIVTSRSDASLLMHQQIADDKLFDAVDLDPYGCPSRFLDAAIQAVRDGGILLVTCTDMAVLAGNSPETCHAKYGAVSLRNNACHEMAIRLTLQCIESHANRYGRYIVPLLSFSADFYIRVIVQVYTSPVTCKKTTSKLSMVYQCVGCQALTLSPLGLATQTGSNQMKFTLPHSPPVNMSCSHCFYQHIVGGPIWSAPIHKISFVERMLSIIEAFRFGTSKRMEGMLEVIKEELPDVPLYYTISGLCAKIHCQAIPIIDFRSALLNAGYRVSLSHASPNSIKTNAPVKTLWDIIRCWVQLNPISKRRLVDGSVSAAILFQEPTLIANFGFHPKAKPNSRIRGLLRFQQNPQRNWGPGTRSRVNVGDNLDDRRRTNQNKKSKKTPVEIIEVITL